MSLKEDHTSRIQTQNDKKYYLSISPEKIFYGSSVYLMTWRALLSYKRVYVRPTQPPVVRLRKCFCTLCPIPLRFDVIKYVSSNLEKLPCYLLFDFKLLNEY